MWRITYADELTNDPWRSCHWTNIFIASDQKAMPSVKMVIASAPFSCSASGMEAGSTGPRGQMSSSVSTVAGGASAAVLILSGKRASTVTLPRLLLWNDRDVRG